MSKIRWIKIVTDIFDDEKMLLIESMPEADSLIVIWFKILCLAGKINNGGVMMLNDKLAYTDEMLSTIFRRPIATIRLALKTFENLGMLLIINDAITIPNWSKHQSLDQLESKNKYMKNYMRDYREKQKKLALKSEEDISKVNSKTNRKTNCKANVSLAEGEEELELERELEEEDIYKYIVDYLNKKSDKNYKYTAKATQRLIDTRMKEGFTLDDFKKVIDNKVSSWKDEAKMNSYLRPSTLFGTKFESYLNEKQADKNKTNYGW